MRTKHWYMSSVLSGLEHLGELNGGIEQLEKANDIIYMMQAEKDTLTNASTDDDKALLVERLITLKFLLVWANCLSLLHFLCVHFLTTLLLFVSANLFI